jgi:hypothetical protein
MFAKCLRLFVLSILLIGGTANGRSAYAADGDVAGTVLRIQGSALAVQDAVPRPLGVGDSVLIGDILSTGKESRLEIRMIDDGLFTLGERTSFVVIDYMFGQNAPNALLRIMSGSFRAITGAIVQADASAFAVETEFGVLGVRGTDFWGGVMEDGAFHAALLGGKGVIFKNRAGSVEITAPEFGTTVTGPDQAPTSPKEWPTDKLDRSKAMVAFQ